MEMCDKLHTLAASDMRKESPVPIVHETEGGPTSGLATSEIRKNLLPLQGVEFSLTLAHMYSAQISLVSLTCVHNNKLYIYIYIYI